MALTVEITDIKVTDAGEQFRGKMHKVSAKMTLKEAEIVVHEQDFSENHKDFHLMPDTMEKIRVKMDAVKKSIETELALKVIAEAEVPTILSKLQGV